MVAGLVSFTRFWYLLSSYTLLPSSIAAINSMAFILLIPSIFSRVLISAVFNSFILLTEDNILWDISLIPLFLVPDFSIISINSLVDMVDILVKDYQRL